MAGNEVIAAFFILSSLVGAVVAVVIVAVLRALGMVK